jgi:hypothetical protein
VIKRKPEIDQTMVQKMAGEPSEGTKAMNPDDDASRANVTEETRQERSGNCSTQCGNVPIENTPANAQTEINQPVCDHAASGTKRVKSWLTRLRSLMTRVEKAMQWKPLVPFENTKFRFEMTTKAALSNLAILADNAYDLPKVITGEEASNTPLRPGSEFRPIDVLEPICRNHPLWPQVHRMLTKGFTMPLRKIPDVDQAHNVIVAIRYGNHKSTQKNLTVVLEMLKEEVEKGWQFVLPCASIPTIPGKQ